MKYTEMCMAMARFMLSVPFKLYFNFEKMLAKRTSVFDIVQYFNPDAFVAS